MGSPSFRQKLNILKQNAFLQFHIHSRGAHGSAYHDCMLFDNLNFHRTVKSLVMTCSENGRDLFQVNLNSLCYLANFVVYELRSCYHYIFTVGEPTVALTSIACCPITQTLLPFHIHSMGVYSSAYHDCMPFNNQNSNRTDKSLVMTCSENGRDLFQVNLNSPLFGKLCCLWAME